MKKMAIAMILLGTLLQLMIGCKENISNNNNLVSTNTVIATSTTTSTSTNTNNEQKDDEFFNEEIDYQMSEEDIEKLQMTLGEVYFLNKNNGYYREYNMKNGLPNGDEEKREFMRMLIQEHFYVYKIFEEYNNSNINVPALNIPMEKINYFFNLALGTTFSNDYKEYFELQLANRGTEQPYSIISSIKQISPDEVRIEGKIGSANENGDGFGLRKENFIAIGKIVDDKTLGGITITEFKCNNQFKDEFVFWDSDVKYLTDNELKNLSLDELAYARNEIYARYGYAFKEEKFKNYFESKNWYKPDKNFIPDDSNLNEYEIANKNLILKYEKKFTGAEISLNDIDGTYAYTKYNKYDLPIYQVVVSIKKTSDSTIIIYMCEGHDTSRYKGKTSEDMTWDELSAYASHKVNWYLGKLNNDGENIWSGKAWFGIGEDLSNMSESEFETKDYANDIKIFYEGEKINIIHSYLNNGLGMELEKQGNSLDPYDYFTVHP